MGIGASNMSIKFHEKLKIIKVVTLEISIQKGLTPFVHERGVLHEKYVG